MFPNELLPGIDMYLIMLCLAAFAAILVFRMFADKLKIGAKLQNFCMINAVLSIIIGYYSAVLFQAFYNIAENGGFVINKNTGATFYGGLIGGAGFFLAVYFVAGSFLFKDTKEHIKRFWSVADIAAACISIAHSLGRVGCLMAGCCHGAQTDAWYGIYMSAVGCKVVPIQLYEAIFLALIFVFFAFRIYHKKTYSLPIYMGAYGVWRFFIEYARDDYRGQTFIKALTPSQLTAILMVMGAIILFVIQRKLLNRKAESSDDAQS